MVKNKIFLFALCALLCSHGGLFGGDLNPKSCTVETYNSQIGVREASGRNDGEPVERYLRSVGFGKGYAWCAAFVNWSLVSCGVRTPQSAWSPSWFPPGNTIYHRGTFEKNTPEPGDVFGIYFTSKKRIAHVGFIDQWDPRSNNVRTVEGNTNVAGSREGDGVYRKYRLKSQIYKVSRWIT